MSIIKRFNLANKNNLNKLTGGIGSLIIMSFGAYIIIFSLVEVIMNGIPIPRPLFIMLIIIGLPGFSAGGLLLIVALSKKLPLLRGIIMVIAGLIIIALTFIMRGEMHFGVILFVFLIPGFLISFSGILNIISKD